MTISESFDTIYRLIALLMVYGLPLCMVAGFRDEPRNTRRAKIEAKSRHTKTLKRGLKGAGSIKATKARRVKKKKNEGWFTAPKLTPEQETLNTRYQIGRDFVMV